MDAYLGGANVHSSVRFLGSANAVQDVTMRNYYLRGVFSEVAGAVGVVSDALLASCWRWRVGEAEADRRVTVQSASLDELRARIRSRYASPQERDSTLVSESRISIPFRIYSHEPLDSF